MFATVCSLFHVPLCLCNHFSLRLKLIVASRQNRWWKSWWVAPTTASETLTQSHFLWTGWESHNFIYSLYPLNLFCTVTRDLGRITSQSFAGPPQTGKHPLTVIFTLRFLPNDVWSVGEKRSILRKPILTGWEPSAFSSSLRHRDTFTSECHFLL